jgi:hypothetical protein
VLSTKVATHLHCCVQGTFADSYLQQGCTQQRKYGYTLNTGCKPAVATHLHCCVKWPWSFCRSSSLSLLLLLLLLPGLLLMPAGAAAGCSAAGSSAAVLLLGWLLLLLLLLLLFPTEVGGSVRGAVSGCATLQIVTLLATATLSPHLVVAAAAAAASSVSCKRDWSGTGLSCSW